MNDIRSFFRYVAPGLIFTLQILIYLSISLCPSRFSQVIDKLSNVGAILSIFLLSGGVGFLLSTVYHTLYWMPCKWMDSLRVNHRPLIETAIKRGWLELYDHTCNPGQGKPIREDQIENQKAAWRIATAFWNIHKKSSKIIKGADERIASLDSTMHGIGTSLVGTILSFIAWWGIHYKICQICPFTLCSGWIVVIVFVVFFVVLFLNFLMVKRDFQSVYEIISNAQLKKRPPFTMNCDKDIDKVFFKKRGCILIIVTILVAILLIILLLLCFFFGQCICNGVLTRTAVYFCN